MRWWSDLMGWRQKSRTVTVFASSLADELYSLVPPSQIHEFLGEEKTRVGKRKEAVKSVKQAQVIRDKLQAFMAKQQGFIVQNRLGIYHKARLQMIFSQRLEALGYSKEDTAAVSRMMLVARLHRT